jgi:hydrogenase nickel incorporation protein HypA/HybF
MHEEATLRDLRRKLDDVARTNGVVRFARVRLWVGALSHFSEASLRGRWEETVVGSAAEGARLDLEISEDRSDPRAQGVVLVSVDAASEGAPGR